MPLHEAALGRKIVIVTQFRQFLASIHLTTSLFDALCVRIGTANHSNQALGVGKHWTWTQSVKRRLARETYRLPGLEAVDIHHRELSLAIYNKIL